MVSETVAKETRQGIIFTARLGKQRFGRVSIQLFIEGQKKPVGTVKVHPWEGGGGTEGLVDRAFQVWVTEGLFYRTVKDPSLLSVLTSAQSERLEEVSWYRKVFRFLPAEGSTCENPRFILTTDKSDLPDRYKRILEVGEDVVQREEAEQEEAHMLYAQEGRARDKNLRTEHAQLIRAVARSAISEKLAPADSIRALSELGLLKPSTSFRSGALFPGESSILWYDFTEEGIRFAGYIGFDPDFQLLSVDERFPMENQVYLLAAA